MLYARLDIGLLAPLNKCCRYSTYQNNLHELCIKILPDTVEVGDKVCVATPWDKLYTHLYGVVTEIVDRPYTIQSYQRPK